MTHSLTPVSTHYTTAGGEKRACKGLQKRRHSTADEAANCHDNLGLNQTLVVIYSRIFARHWRMCVRGWPSRCFQPSLFLMARIVLTTWGSYGDINPYLGLALALKARGHEPVLATAAYYRPAVEREGIEFRDVRPDIDPGNSEIVARVIHPKRGPEVILRELTLPGV